MMGYSFDGANKRVTLTSGTVTLDLVALHTAWKDWVFAGNAQYALAFKTVGGDIPAIPLYLFLLNGWRIVPQSADHVLSVTNGILEVDGGGDPFVDPAGSYKIRINRQAPGIAIGYSTTGGSTPSDIASAVLAALNTAAIPVNVKQVNDRRIKGSGIPPTYANMPKPIDPGDPWVPE